MNHLCEYCHQRPKNPNFPDTKWCSSNCKKADAANNLKTNNLCEHCHQKPKNPNFPGTKWCSKNCERASHPSVPMMNNLCEKCYQRPKNPNFPGTKWCSKNCEKANRSNISIQEQVFCALNDVAPYYCNKNARSDGKGSFYPGCNLEHSNIANNLNKFQTY